MKKSILLLGVLFFSVLPNYFLFAQLEIVPAFPNLTFDQPVDIQFPNDQTNRLFIVSQPGIIYTFENNTGVGSKKIFLDITNRVLFGGEQGLLGLAFHPDFKNNGYFFVDYTKNNPRRTIISRFKVKNGSPNEADLNSELILMEIAQPYSNHNGGQISFGEDGYLYISLGDGGSGGDPQNNAQNLRSHLGKILRIDVNKTQDPYNYSIPIDNPFKGNTNGLKEEIFAWGLRNVWKFSFDKSSSTLWAADVGQNAWEEINIIQKGKNYGWRIMEGNHCFNPSSGCDTSNLTLPIWEYGHNQNGGYSITGGYVYRGSSASEIFGNYIYGDFVTGNIWALELSGSNIKNKLLFKTNHSVSTFGVDSAGELYFANYATGRLYKIVGSPKNNVGSNELPSIFQLKQNYPNPFNSSTIISFVVPVGANVSLKVYDPLGKQVSTLIDEFKQSGEYEISFNVETLSSSFMSSGVYYYKMESDNFSDAKKMLLIK